MTGAIRTGIDPSEALRVRVFMPDVPVVGLLWRARDRLRESVLRQRFLEVQETRILGEEATVSGERRLCVPIHLVDHVCESRAVLRPAPTFPHDVLLCFFFFVAETTERGRVRRTFGARHTLLRVVAPGHVVCQEPYFLGRTLESALGAGQPRGGEGV